MLELPPIFDLRQQVLLSVIGGGELRAAIIGRSYAWGGMKYDVVVRQTGEIVRSVPEPCLRPVGRPALRVIEARS